MLATKDQLLNRGMSLGGVSPLCVLWNSSEESSNHLFLSCGLTGNVWKSIMKWMGIEVKLDVSSHVSFSRFSRSIRKEAGNLEGIIIWPTTVWCIWIGRNNVIFRYKNFSIEVSINSIKFHSWRWLYVDSRYPNFCVLYDLFVSPVNCLKWR